MKDLGYDKQNQRSAHFVKYCADKTTELLNICIPNSTSGDSFCSRGIKSEYGEFVAGPIRGDSPTAEPGDVVLLRTKLVRKYPNEYACDVLGIVTDVGKTTFEVVSVDSIFGKVNKQTYRFTNNKILGYFRPDWSRVSNDTTLMAGYTTLGKLYDTENTKEDATIREVGYLSDKYEPTIKKSKIKLAVVNYTTVLSSIMDNISVPYTSNMLGTNVSVDGITPKNAAEIIEYFISKGLNAAAACGICGNIYYEAGDDFNTGAEGDYHGGKPTSFGLCQWHYGRGDAMKRMAGPDWKNNLTGQLDYLWYELQNGYKTTVLDYILTVENSVEGAKNAADRFVRKFEIPDDMDNQSKCRQAKAAEYFNALVVQLDGISNYDTPSQSPVSGTTIDVPSWVVQSGINTSYTNYSYQYSRWGKSTNQYLVAQKWNDTGRKSNRNICTIDGRYLVAVKPIFGIPGDKITVHLDDGTSFKAIIGDGKGSENGSTGAAAYVHTNRDLIEWEVSGPAIKSTIDVLPDISGWEGKNVTKIINEGSIL